MKGIDSIVPETRLSDLNTPFAPCQLCDLGGMTGPLSSSAPSSLKEDKSTYLAGWLGGQVAFRLSILWGFVFCDMVLQVSPGLGDRKDGKWGQTVLMGLSERAN